MALHFGKTFVVGDDILFIPRSFIDKKYSRFISPSGLSLPGLDNLWNNLHYLKRGCAGSSRTRTHRYLCRSAVNLRAWSVVTLHGKCTIDTSYSLSRFRSLICHGVLIGWTSISTSRALDGTKPSFSPGIPTAQRFAIRLPFHVTISHPV